MSLSFLKIYVLLKQRQKLILDKDKQEKLEICVVRANVLYRTYKLQVEWSIIFT